MTRSEAERIAVLETKVDITAKTVESIDGKVDLLLDYMTMEKARRKGITEVFGLGRATLLLALPIGTFVMAIFNNIVLQHSP